MWRFLREWGPLVVTPWKLLSGAIGLAKILVPLIPTSVVVFLGLAIVSLGTVPWWTVPAAVLAAVWLAATAGMALERARGPEIRVGPLELDTAVKVLYVLITNGPAPVKVRALIVRVSDSSSPRRILEHSWEGHWRGRPADFDGQLRPYEEAQYGLLIVIRFPESHPGIYLFSREVIQDQHRAISLSRNLPLTEQGDLKFDVSFTCESEADKHGKRQRGKTIERSFSLVPDPSPSSSASYRIVVEEAPPFMLRWSSRWDGLRRVMKAAWKAMKKERLR
jgi:hypothetical protein